MCDYQQKQQASEARAAALEQQLQTAEQHRRLDTAYSAQIEATLVERVRQLEQEQDALLALSAADRAEWAKYQATIRLREERDEARAALEQAEREREALAGLVRSSPDRGGR